jgi:hypothetical protein
MKKFLPFIIAGVGVLIVIVAALLIKFGSREASSTPADQITSAPVLPQSEWPVISLIPTADPKIPNSLGHLLELKVQKINIPGAFSMDYELIYNTTNGGQQGVPGTVRLTGGDIDKVLLLGSESSGNYRFDEGVNQGTITVTFRDSSGKLIGKLTSEFTLQSNTTTLSSADGKFKYTLDKLAKNVFFVTMQSFAAPDPSTTVITSNGYSIFASDGKHHPGTVTP